jgi:tetratricopeptide (TPR) repeat protein
MEPMNSVFSTQVLARLAQGRFVPERRELPDGSPERRSVPVAKRMVWMDKAVFYNRCPVLLKIAQTLNQPDGKLVQVVGPHGSGKTALARALCELTAHVAWVDVPPDPSQTATVLLQTLRPFIELTDRALASGQAPEALLLVLDNLDRVTDPEPLKTVLTDVMALPGLRLLLLGEHPLLDGPTYRVEALSQAEAQAMLARVAAEHWHTLYTLSEGQTWQIRLMTHLLKHCPDAVSDVMSHGLGAAMLARLSPSALSALRVLALFRHPVSKQALKGLMDIDALLNDPVGRWLLRRTWLPREEAPLHLYAVPSHIRSWLKPADPTLHQGVLNFYLTERQLPQSNRVSLLGSPALNVEVTHHEAQLAQQPLLLPERNLAPDDWPDPDTTDDDWSDLAETFEKPVGYPPSEALTAFQEAQSLEAQGLLDEAYDRYKEASLSEDALLRAAAKANLARIHWEGGEPRQALSWFQSSLVDDRLADHPDGQLDTLLATAQIHQGMGNLPQAKLALLDGIALAQRTERPFWLATMHYELGRLLEQQNQWRDALQAFTMAEKIGRESLSSQSVSLLNQKIREIRHVLRTVEGTAAQT